MNAKEVTSPDGQTIQVRVVDSNSKTLAQDFLQAFRLSVKEILEERKK